MSGPEQTHNTFGHGDLGDGPRIDPGDSHIIFEPQVPRQSDVATDGPLLSRAEVMGQIRELEKQVIESGNLQPNQAWCLGDKGEYTLREVCDAQAGSPILELRVMGQGYPCYALGQLAMEAARVARRSGFDPDKSTVSTSVAGELPLARPPHTDAFIRSTSEVRGTRFIYTTGPGTIIYPAFDVPRMPDNVPPRLYMFDGDAQQIVPGYMLAFNAASRLWHCAPPKPRMTFVVDISQSPE